MAPSMAVACRCRATLPLKSGGGGEYLGVELPTGEVDDVLGGPVTLEVDRGAGWHPPGLRADGLHDGLPKW